jgi:RND family efflux transporter MFP subunit
MSKSVVAAAAMVISSLVTLSCTKQEAKPTAAPKVEPIKIQTIAVETITVNRTVTASGSLSADEQVVLTSEVPGRIVSLPVDFGSYVRKGQVLAQLDTRELQIAVDRTKANLAQALARIGLDPNQADQRPESSPAVRAAQAQFEDAKQKFERTQKLIKSGDIPEERAIEVEKLFSARQAQLDQTKDDLRTQWASIEAIKAEVRLAEKRLGDGVIRAPFDGMITERPAALGQFVKDANPLMTLVKTRPLRLRIEVPEDASGEIRVGTTLTFKTDAAPEKSFQAVVGRVDAGLDSRSRTLQVEARVTDSDARLRPGVFATVALVSQRGVQVPVAPKSAILTVAGLNKVYVVTGDRVTERRIPLGEMHGEKMELPAELGPGTRLANSEVTRLSNNAAVIAEGR